MMFDTPEGIELYRIASIISALKLEQKGIRMSSKVRKLRKPMATFLGLKSNATYDQVIAGMEAHKTSLLSKKQ